MRGIFSPFAHPLFTSFIGIGVGVAVVDPAPVWGLLAPLLGYVVAVAAHALWNGSAFLDGGQAFVLTYVVRDGARRSCCSPGSRSGSAAARAGC